MDVKYKHRKQTEIKAKGGNFNYMEERPPQTTVANPEVRTPTWTKSQISAPPHTQNRDRRFRLYET